MGQLQGNWTIVEGRETWGKFVLDPRLSPVWGSLVADASCSIDALAGNRKEGGAITLVNKRMFAHCNKRLSIMGGGLRRVGILPTPVERSKSSGQSRALIDRPLCIQFRRNIGTANHVTGPALCLQRISQ